MKTKSFFKISQTILSGLFLAIVLFWALNACNMEAPKEEKPTVTDMIIDSLVLKHTDSIKPVVADTTKK